MATDLASSYATLTAQPTQVEPPTLMVAEQTAFVQNNPSLTDITESDMGLTRQFVYMERFYVYLDGERHPRTDLRCEPNGVIAQMPDDYYRGRYPVRYEAIGIGSCQLRTNDFNVTIEVRELK